MRCRCLPGEGRPLVAEENRISDVYEQYRVSMYHWKTSLHFEESAMSTTIVFYHSSSESLPSEGSVDVCLDKAHHALPFVLRISLAHIGHEISWLRIKTIT